MPEMRKLNVFLSYASQDETRVRELYSRLAAESWISLWFDKEMLLPGMDWDLEIYKGLRAADAILVFLSKESVAKEGYVQKEFKRALGYAEEKPDGTIFLIPVRLDNCQPPVKFQQWQWLDYFAANAHDTLLKSLRIRAKGLGIAANASQSPTPAPISMPMHPDDDLDLYKFIKINSSAVSYPFWIGKYPVTNAQYARFLKADDFAKPEFWKNFPKYDENCQLIGAWVDEGWNWLKENLKGYEYFPPEIWKVVPEFWRDWQFGIAQSNNPVVGVTWFEASAYCKWLLAHWNELHEAQANTSLQPKILRLSLEPEWVIAAGGNKPEGRFPWDLPGMVTKDEQEIHRRANVTEKATTPVNLYPDGKSPHGVMDLYGNVWEWQANCLDKKQGRLALRGGSWDTSGDYMRTHVRRMGDFNNLVNKCNYIGFRVAAFLSK